MRNLDSMWTGARELALPSRPNPSLSAEKGRVDVPSIRWRLVAKMVSAFALLVVLTGIGVAAQTHVIEMETERLITASNQLP